MYTLLDEFFGHDFSIKLNGDHAVELDDSFILTIELPGVKKDDIKTEIDGDLLTIKAERKNPFDKSAKVLINSRSFKPFNKTYKIGFGIDKNSIEAEFVDGVLSLKLPKEEKSKTRKIQIT